MLLFFTSRLLPQRFLSPSATNFSVFHYSSSDSDGNVTRRRLNGHMKRRAPIWIITKAYRTCWIHMVNRTVRRARGNVKSDLWTTREKQQDLERCFVKSISFVNWCIRDRCEKYFNDVAWKISSERRRWRSWISFWCEIETRKNVLRGKWLIGRWGKIFEFLNKKIWKSEEEDIQEIFKKVLFNLKSINFLSGENSVNKTAPMFKLN